MLKELFPEKHVAPPKPNPTRPNMFSVPEQTPPDQPESPPPGPSPRPPSSQSRSAQPVNDDNGPPEQLPDEIGSNRNGNVPSNQVEIHFFCFVILSCRALLFGSLIANFIRELEFT